MPFDETLDNRQSHSGGFEFPGGMQALEYTEQPVHKFHIEARAIIPNG
jgi:hypothetical protein